MLKYGREFGRNESESEKDNTERVEDVKISANNGTGYFYPSYVSCTRF